MSQKIKRILVGTSLAEASDPVILAAHALSHQTGAELHVFHAFPLPIAYYGSPLGLVAVNPEMMESERMKRKLQVQEQLMRVGIDEAAWPAIMLDVGAPHRMLDEAIQTLEPDLLVVGSAESKGPLAPILGSTSDRVVRKATCPVLVVRGELALPPARVLAPVDLSELCEDSLRRGLEMLDQMRGTAKPTFEALFVLSRIDREGSVQFTSEQIDRFAAEELDRFLARVDEGAEHGIQPVIRNGLPRQEILAYLEESPADLVILGTHGRSGFERLLLGSVAAEVVHRAEASVLVVPPTPARQAHAAKATAEEGQS